MRGRGDAAEDARIEEEVLAEPRANLKPHTPRMLIVSINPDKLGAIIGMSAGLGICAYYMYMTYPFFGVNAPKWWDINPISAGTFGMQSVSEAARKLGISRVTLHDKLHKHGLAGGGDE